MIHKTGYSSRNRPLLVPYAEFLDTISWSTFCTFTSHRRMTLKSGRRLMVKLMRHFLNRYGSETMMFWVVEPFHDNNSSHIHALIKITETPERLNESILAAWHNVAKPAGYKKHNLATIEHYIPGKGAHYYVAKYLQMNNIDYDLF